MTLVFLSALLDLPGISIKSYLAAKLVFAFTGVVALRILR